jgi:hypothetical protein
VSKKLVVAFAFILSACASKPVMEVENSESMFKNQEYEKAVEVKSLPDSQNSEDMLPAGAYVLRDAPAYVLPPSVLQAQALEQTAKKMKREKARAAAKAAAAAALAAAKAAAVAPTAAAEPAKRQPEIEPSEGFQGRRPIKDPFRVGEAVTLELSYFNVVAGDLTLEVRPFKQVNGRKSYDFAGVAKSTSVFSMFYTVNDWVETFVDYDDMIPYNYSLNVKETKQLREVKSYFDWQKLRGYVWDKKVTKEKEGLEEKKYEWDIVSFAQNVFSAPFYIRTFHLEPGKKIQFRIGHEGKNILMTADVLRRETLTTKLGELKTVVISPHIEIDGVFKPMGDVLFWLTDDDRKFIVRIESKIKIGTIVGKVKSINPGE